MKKFRVIVALLVVMSMLVLGGCNIIDSLGRSKSYTTGAEFEFDNLLLTIGDYSFDVVDNMFSEYDGQTVVKVAVTIKNLSNSPHSLNRLYCTCFNTSGKESPDVSRFFDDSVGRGGDLLQDSSCVEYWHILYDGDGVYTIVIDDMLFTSKTINIEVKK